VKVGFGNSVEIDIFSFLTIVIMMVYWNIATAALLKRITVARRASWTMPAVVISLANNPTVVSLPWLVDIVILAVILVMN
tara:strand:- start:325 stop:564 length:240 start_codon:yes stop_codon:yes gene_type:complete